MVKEYQGGANQGRGKGAGEASGAQEREEAPRDSLQGGRLRAEGARPEGQGAGFESVRDDSPRDPKAHGEGVKPSQCRRSDGSKLVRMRFRPRSPGISLILGRPAGNRSSFGGSQ